MLKNNDFLMDFTIAGYLFSGCLELVVGAPAIQVILLGLLALIMQMYAVYQTHKK